MTMMCLKEIASLDLGALSLKLRGTLKQNADLTKISWFRTGGSATLLFEPEDEEDLSLFLQLLPSNIPITVLGIGSNLLIRDGGVPGVVIRLASKAFCQLTWLDNLHFCAGAGISDKKIAMAALEREVGGFHFYYGIPGSLGGALRMNAGANGVETCECVVSVRAMDRQGKIHQFSCQELGYSYRHAALPESFIFLSAILKGYPSDKITIRSEMDKVQAHREAVQPIREKTGGSTFRNPQGISAWQAIDQAGCRGLTIGKAMMSPMHCNFMINQGGASAYDLELLGETVRRKVYEHSQILLQWEIARLGVFVQGQEIVPFSPEG